MASGLSERELLELQLSERDLEEVEARGMDFKTFKEKIKDAFKKIKEHVKQGREEQVERELLTQEETESLKRSLEVADLSERNLGQKIKDWFKNKFGREVAEE